MISAPERARRAKAIFSSFHNRGICLLLLLLFCLPLMTQLTISSLQQEPFELLRCRQQFLINILFVHFLCSSGAYA